MNGNVENLFENIPGKLPDELVTVLLDNRQVRVERIVSTGQASAAGYWYDQEEDEWVLLLTGRAKLRFAGQEDNVLLVPGDHCLIPAHRRHRVEWTTPDEPTIWLAVFFPASGL